MNRNIIVKPHDMSECYFCGELVFPIIDGIQYSFIPYDGGPTQKDGYKRWHQHCIEEVQELYKLSKTKKESRE